MVTESAKELIVDVMLNHYRLGEFYVREMGNFHLSTEWVIDNFRIVDNFMRHHPDFILVREEGNCYLTHQSTLTDNDREVEVIKQLVVDPDNIEVYVVKSRLDGLLFDYSFDTSEAGRQKLYDKWLKIYEGNKYGDDEEHVWFFKCTLKELLGKHLKTEATEFRQE